MRAALVAPLWRAVKMNDTRDETTPEAPEFRRCVLFLMTTERRSGCARPEASDNVRGLRGAPRPSRRLGVGWFELVLLPEPRPKARNLPTRYGARDGRSPGEQDSTCRASFRCFEQALSGADGSEAQ